LGAGGKRLLEGFGLTWECALARCLLRQWAEQGVDHSGVILVNERTLPQNDVGGLFAALCAVWRAHGDWDWTNRVIYLRSAP